MDNDFFVTVSSNGALQTYPSNTLSAFTIPLAEPLNLGLNSNYVVGLAEAYFPPLLNAEKNLEFLETIQLTDIDYKKIYEEMPSMKFEEWMFNYFDDKLDLYNEDNLQLGLTLNAEIHSEKLINTYSREVHEAKSINAIAKYGTHIRSSPTTGYNLKNVIFYCVRSLRDVGFIDLDYFRDFIDPSIFFGKKVSLEMSKIALKYDLGMPILSQKHLEEVEKNKITMAEAMLKVHPQKEIPLDLTCLVRPIETEHTFFPVFAQEDKYRTLFENLKLKLFTYYPYTLRRILYQAIKKIMANFSYWNLDAATHKSYDASFCKTGECNIGEEQRKILNNEIHLDILIKRFIKRFVVYSLQAREDVEKSRAGKNFPKNIFFKEPEYCIIYTDIVTDHIINNQRANILAIVHRDDLKSGYAKFNPIRFINVSQANITSISVKLQTWNGQDIPFADSAFPVTLLLKFIKT